MKLQIILLIIIFSLIILTVYCDDFLLGAYLYNKNVYPEIYHRTLCDSMNAAGFNAAICSAQDDKSPLGVTNMLAYMNQSGIKGILEDYIFAPDFINPTNSIYGARTISSGNYFRFEAEYCDLRSLSQDDSDNPDKYFYMSSNTVSSRVGRDSSSTDFSNGNCWQVNNGEMGYAYQDLTYKWPQPNNLIQFRRIGEEFRFPESRLDDSNYLFNNNVLYITYAMNCPDTVNLPNSTVLAKISLTRKGQYTNSTDPTVIIPHDYGVFTSCDTTFVTKEMYLNSPTDDPYFSLNHLITVSVPIPRLNSSGALKDGPTYDKMLKYLVPNLYWNGHGRLRLDYIDFEDKLHKDYTSRNDVLAQIRTFGLPYLYGYDEPVQGQFDSFFRISRYWENNGNHTQLIAAINEPVKVVTNYSGEVEYYRHRKAYIEAVKPKTFVIDEYPFKDGRVPNWTDVNSPNFVQNYIGEMCKEYDDYKTLCHNENRDFIAVPQTYGKWNPTTHNWDVLYPPDKVMKSLQFLPLCYQAKGIIDFKFEGAISSSNAINTALMNSYNGQYYCAKQYEAIREANSKIKTYGALLNSDGFEWLGADSIMTYSPSFDVSGVFLDNLYVTSTTKSSQYQGWIQAGFYKKDYTFPYLMLVNRRAIHTHQNLNTISPISTPPLQTYNDSYKSAPSQTVRLFPSSNPEVEQHIGTHIALYDPYDSTLYIQKNTIIDVPIGPGDGKLLQMVGTLPATVKANAVIKSTGYIKGKIVIKHKSDVTFDVGSDVTLYHGSIIRINKGSSLIIKGVFKKPGDARIIVKKGGILKFENTDAKLEDQSIKSTLKN